MTNQLEINFSEKEFLSLVTNEMSFKETAEKMFCNPGTVEGYRDNLSEK